MKTKSDEYPDWQWVVKKDGTIFRALSERDDFTVLVNLAMDNKSLRFYIVPTTIVDRWLKGDFDEWLQTPGKYGRAHDPTNTKRHLSEKKHAQELAQYLDGWDTLWN